MSMYEITFAWPNGDWTWVLLPCKDFHEAMLKGLQECPADCRIHSIVRIKGA